MSIPKASYKISMTIVGAAAVTAGVLLAVVLSAMAPPAGARTAASPPGADDPAVIYQANDSGRQNRLERHLVYCPAGYVATGSGIDVNGSAYEGVGGLWTVSPVNSRFGNYAWQEAYSFHNTPTSRGYTGYAVCVKESLLPGLTTVSRHESAMPDEYVGVTARCPNDMVRIGGGEETTVRGSNMIWNELNPQALPDLVRSQPDVNDSQAWISTIYNHRFSFFPDPSRYISFMLEVKVLCVPKGVVDVRMVYHANTARDGTPTSSPACPSSNPYLISGGGGMANGDAKHTRWRSLRPGGGNPPKDWFAGAYKSGSLTLWSLAICAKFNAEPASKSSGKNPGWGDGVGGGRFK